MYAPDGRTSASPSSTSITEEAPHWEITWRVSANARSGSSAPLRTNSLMLGCSRSPRSMSLNGVVPWRVTTRIISSGVTPLAHSEAMNAPAEVPT